MHSDRTHLYRGCASSSRRIVQVEFGPLELPHDCRRWCVRGAVHGAGEEPRVYGSAGRAAVALAPAVSAVTSLTSASDVMQRRIAALSQVYGFEQRCAPAPVAIAFDYVHPLSVPLITPAPSVIKRVPSIHASGDVVIRFGMLEADVIANAKVAIYDLQSAFAPDAFRTNGSDAERLAVVLNASEVLALSGVSGDGGCSAANSVRQQSLMR